MCMEDTIASKKELEIFNKLWNCFTLTFSNLRFRRLHILNTVSVLLRFFNNIHFQIFFLSVISLTRSSSVSPTRITTLANSTSYPLRSLVAKKGAATSERRGGGRGREKSGPLRDTVLAVQGNGESADTLAAKW